MSPWTLAWTQLRRRWRATLSAAAGIAVACLCCELGATWLETHRRWVAGLGSPFDAVIGPKSDGIGLFLEATELLLPSEDVIPFGLANPPDALRFDDLVDLHVFAAFRGSPVIGVSRLYQSPRNPLRPRVVQGRWFEAAGEVVLGARVASREKLVPGASLEIRHSPSRSLVEDFASRGVGASRLDFEPAAAPFAPVEKPLFRRTVTVVGIVDHGGTAMDGAIFAPRALGEEWYALARSHGLARPVSIEGPTTYLLVRVPDVERRQASELAFLHGTTAHWVSTTTELAALETLLGRARTVLFVLAGLVIAMMAAGMAALSSARYDALLHQLGLLHAIGYGRRSLVGWFVIEAVLLAALALAAAAVTAALLSREAFLSPFLLAPAEPAGPFGTTHMLLRASVLASAAIGAAGVATLRLLRVRGADLIRGT